jgi:hypothetical protein
MEEKKNKLPFVINIKCIAFSIFIIFIIFMEPPKIKNIYARYFLMYIIFFISYVAMAWYDYFYNCDPMIRGNKSLTGIFKPELKNKETKVVIERSKIGTYLFHLFFIMPFLVYVAYNKNKNKDVIYQIMMILGVMTMIYHGAYAFITIKSMT